MSMALGLYDLFDINNDEFLRQMSIAEYSVENDKIDDVSYRTYKFKDGSSLRLGDNGYIGCQY